MIDKRSSLCPTPKEVGDAIADKKSIRAYFAKKEDAQAWIDRTKGRFEKGEVATFLFETAKYSTGREEIFRRYPGAMLQKLVPKSRRWCAEACPGDHVFSPSDFMAFPVNTVERVY